MKLVASSLIIAALSGSAVAGVLSNTALVPAYGFTRGIAIYRVASDLPSPSVQLQPEGMTWYNGTLYASGDAGAVTAPSESNGYIAAYPGGNLGSAPTPIGQFSQAGRAFGPEGITVNTRGSGYGAFSTTSPALVGVDSAGGTLGRVLTTLNTATSTATNTLTSYPINTDDIAFVPGATAAQDRFALIDAGASTIVLRFVSATDGTTVEAGTSFALPNQSKGLLYLSPSDAQWFDPGSFDVSGGAFLVAVSPDFVGDTNKLNLYTATGTLISSIVLPTGPGLLANIEALAWDPSTQRLFIGDENGANSQIAVMVVPTPTAVGMLALGTLAAARRRR